MHYLSHLDLLVLILVSPLVGPLLKLTERAVENEHSEVRIVRDDFVNIFEEKNGLGFD